MGTPAGAAVGAYRRSLRVAVADDLLLAESLTAADSFTVTLFDFASSFLPAFVRAMAAVRLLFVAVGVPLAIVVLPTFAASLKRACSFAFSAIRRPLRFRTVPIFESRIFTLASGGVVSGCGVPAGRSFGVPFEVTWRVPCMNECTVQ